jgi:hypothetical protein
MPIVPLNNPIDHAVGNLIADVRRAILYNLQYVGERCVIEARQNANFIDRTGNLRSSLGYVIVEDGRVVTTGGLSATKGGGEGVSEGRKFLSDVVSEFPQGIVLVCAAGMKYAAYVAAKGYNVEDSAEQLAQRLVPKLIKQLGLKGN